MNREVDITRYQPGMMKEVQEFQILAKAENAELLLLWNGLDEVFQNQFVETLTEEGCQRWESMLGLIPERMDSLETRRFCILAELNTCLPYTYRVLEKTLDSLCGKDNYVLKLDANNYQLLVWIARTQAEKQEFIKKILDQMIPVNLILNYSLIYNTHQDVRACIHEALRFYTYKEVREEPLLAELYTRYQTVKKYRHEELKEYTHEEIRKWLAADKYNFYQTAGSYTNQELRKETHLKIRTDKSLRNRYNTYQVPGHFENRELRSYTQKSIKENKILAEKNCQYQELRIIRYRDLRSKTQKSIQQKRLKNKEE